MRRLLIGLWLIVWVALVVVYAQDSGLVVEEVTIAAQTDAFGQEIQVAQGQLLNQGDTAYNNLTLLAEVYDAQDELVGEGMGFPVNACGAGFLPDFALQPDVSQPFIVPLELYEADAEIDRVEIIPQGAPTDPQDTGSELPNGITRVSDHEVVSVEWIDSQSLRFAAGCSRDLFTHWTWYEYNVASGVQQPAPHPKADIINNASQVMLTQLELDEPFDVENSFISFQPNGRRMAYQNSRNSFLTAEPDGSFRRLLADRLHNRTLQGIQWLQDGNFLAYYYGAYGDPVLYFTGNIEGGILSEHPVDTLPSLIAPGASPDGSRIILAATINDVTGYYLKLAPYHDTTELLFEGEPPGNNWPGPLYMRPPGDAPRILYFARPVDGEAYLQCFNLTTRQLRDLSPLPLQLATDERAWWWLSPDNQRIALAANGLHSGLWMIELSAFDSCA
jgi:hypothetical protein